MIAKVQACLKLWIRGHAISECVLCGVMASAAAKNGGLFQDIDGRDCAAGD